MQRDPGPVRLLEPARSAGAESPGPDRLRGGFGGGNLYLSGSWNFVGVSASNRSQILVVGQPMHAQRMLIQITMLTVLALAIP